MPKRRSIRLGNRLTLRPKPVELPKQPISDRRLTKGPKLRYRDPDEPYRPHLEPDLDSPTPALKLSKRRKLVLERLPKPILQGGIGGGAPDCEPQWNSVALFFNFSGNDLPSRYAPTSVSDAKAFLDEGSDPCTPGISEALCRYWATLTYGQLAFGLDTPRKQNGAPRIPTLAVPETSSGADDWGQLIRACIEANPVAVWKAAGQLTLDGKRWIPSVVLVQNYKVRASAKFGGFDIDAGGHTYHVGDRTHIQFGLDTWAPDDAPSKKGRSWWATLNHEFGHNFVEFGDLYGPQGCTGYWDLLGDNSPPGRMSEVCSVLKQRIGWLNYVQVFEGPIFAKQPLKLRPYTTTGEAIKIIPDPEHTPHEYFVLEFRKSTGAEVWRPDGALPEPGLLILHINERLGIPSTWLLREAPFFDPEFADASDQGTTDWTSHEELAGKVFPQGKRDAFTPQTTPSSDLYGGRRSGVWVTDIRVVGNECHFSLELKGLASKVRWTVGGHDRALAGRFTNGSASKGEELFMRNRDNAALLIQRQAHWMVERRHKDWIGSWNLGRNDRELVGDLDGDGRDEIYIRSNEYAGVIEWRTSRFRTVTVQHDRIGEWKLGPDNWERLGDLDGDGAAEIYIRSPQWAGVMKLVAGRLRLQSIQHDRIGKWNLGPDNEEFVGAFRSPGVDEIAIRSPEWLGLLRYDVGAKRLRLAKIQHDWVDGWNLGKNDQHLVGDFDGDGRDEIYIRSARWAGVLKWVGGRFRVLWMIKDKIPHPSGAADRGQALTGDDHSYVGRFRADRDGILHRDAGGVSVLVWSGSEMEAVQRLDSSFNRRWDLGGADKFVLGDFHRLGDDIVEVGKDHIVDGITDVFIHNSWGTGMIGVNPLPDRDPQFGLTWIQQGVLLADD